MGCQGVDQRLIARRIGTAHIVDWFHQAAAQQELHVTIDDRVREHFVVGTCKPIGQRNTSIERVVDLFATQRLGLQALAVRG